MTIEEIKAVKEAEKEAEKIRIDAQKRAAQIIKEAKNKAEELIEQAIKEAEHEGTNMVRDAEESSSKEVDNIKKEYEQKYKVMEEQAFKNMDKAVNFIMERIVTTNGKS